MEKYIGMMSVIEPRCYPICAKRFLKRFEHIKITDVTRSVRDETAPALEYELNDLYNLSEQVRELIK